MRDMVPGSRFKAHGSSAMILGSWFMTNKDTTPNPSPTPEAVLGGSVGEEAVSEQGKGKLVR